MEIGGSDNWILYKLLFNGHYLFFIREYQEAPYRNNVFWVNILKEGSVFAGYENEKIITYRLGENRHGKRLYIKGKEYTGIHTGNLFNQYIQTKETDASSINERDMWNDIDEQLNGLETDNRFMVSYFGRFIIAHSLKK